MNFFSPLLKKIRNWRQWRITARALPRYENATNIFMPPSKKGGHIALLLSVGRSVGRSVHQQFPFIFFALVAHTEMKFGMVKFCLDLMIEPFLTELCPWTLKNSSNLQFPFIFFALDAHIEMNFGVQIYRKNILVKFYFGYDRTIIDRVMPLGLRKIPIICSFCSVSLQRLHILK